MARKLSVISEATAYVKTLTTSGGRMMAETRKLPVFIHRTVKNLAPQAQRRLGHRPHAGHPVAAPHLCRCCRCPTYLGASSWSVRQRSGSDVPQNSDLVTGRPGSVSFLSVSALRTHLELITCVSPCPCYVSGFVCFPRRFLTVCESALLYLRFPFSLSGFRLYAFLVASLLLRVCLALVCFGAKGVRVEYHRVFWGAAIES